MKLQKGRETEKKTANVQMPRTVGVVYACQLPFELLRVHPREIKLIVVIIKLVVICVSVLVLKQFTLDIFLPPQKPEEAS